MGLNFGIFHLRSWEFENFPIVTLVGWCGECPSPFSVCCESFSRNTGCLCRAIRALSPSGPSAGAETGLSRLHGVFLSHKHSTLQSCQRRGSVAVWPVLAAIAASVSGRVRRVSSQSVALCLSCHREWPARCRLSCGGAPVWCVC